MTDEERIPTPEESAADDTADYAPQPSDDDDTLIAELEAASGTPPPAPVDDWMVGDIDAALAAVASLSEIMPEREAEAEARADARRSAPAFVPRMQLPPVVTLKRGRLGSLVPALFLIGIGAWLTLMTTAGTPPDPLLVAGVVVGGIVLSLLAHWLGTGRWSFGLLFFALLLLLLAGVVFFSLQPTGLDPQRAYPLVLVALGLAMTLAGLLGRPFSLRLMLPGLLVVLAGGVGLAVTLGYVPPDLLTTAVTFAPAVLVVVLVLLLLPLIFRRRRKPAPAADY